MVAELVQAHVIASAQGASVQRLRELEAETIKAFHNSRATSTHAAYQSDFDDFTHWCRANQLSPLPADSRTVALYLTSLALPEDDRDPLAMATIQRRIASLGEAHKTVGFENPCIDPYVKQVVKGLRRKLGVAPKHRKDGLSTADIKAIIEHIDGDRPIDHRDKAILLLGFATALRRSELVALTTDDLEKHPEGLVVHKRRSKTDQEQEGKRIEVAYGEHPYTCPVRATRNWLAEADINHGPIFRAVNNRNQISDQALSDRSVARIIKKHVAKLGFDPNDFAGHSLRRGFATEATRNGANERTVAHTTHHTSTRGLEPYIEDAELFTDPPSRYLGL